MVLLRVELIEAGYSKGGSTAAALEPVMTRFYPSAANGTIRKETVVFSHH